MDSRARNLPGNLAHRWQLSGCASLCAWFFQKIGHNSKQKLQKFLRCGRAASS